LSTTKINSTKKILRLEKNKEFYNIDRKFLLYISAINASVSGGGDSFV